MEGLSKSDANLIVYVHPSQSKNVDKAILRELSSLLFKFVPLPFHFLLNSRLFCYFSHSGFFIAGILKHLMELSWLIVLTLKINVREFSLGFTLISVSDFEQTC
jgi:hypothetical protein